MPSRPRFNPRAPCGARPPGPKQRGPLRTFQSTRPVWGATLVSSLHNTRRTFQSTRPVWGATQPPILRLPEQLVSIHAPRVGRDYSLRRSRQLSSSFNPRAPCGARQMTKDMSDPRYQFQSTRPVWGATTLSSDTVLSPKFQSTRPVWGATRDKRKKGAFGGFQSTRPVWGATYIHIKIKIYVYVSIHAPRVGRDSAA